MQVTGITDIDKLVSGFIKIEDENFAQFNYVNELYTENEALQEEIREKKSDMAEMNKASTQADKRRKEIFSLLEERFTEVASKRQKIQERYKREKKILDQLKPKIDVLFKSIKCNRSAITDLLGNTAGLTDSNVMSFLGIVEQRTNELLQGHSIQKLKYGLDDANKNLMILDSMLPTAGERCPPLCIRPPSIADDDDLSSPINETFNEPAPFKDSKALINKGDLHIRKGTKDNEKHIQAKI